MMKSNSFVSEDQLYRERGDFFSTPKMDRENALRRLIVVNQTGDKIYHKKAATTPELLKIFEELDQRWSTQKSQMNTKRKSTMVGTDCKNDRCEKHQPCVSLPRRISRSSHRHVKKFSNESYLEWLNRTESLTPTATLERRLAYNPYGNWHWKRRLGALSSQSFRSKYNRLSTPRRPQLPRITDNSTVSTVSSSEVGFEKSSWTEPIQINKGDYSYYDQQEIHSVTTRLGPIFDGEHVREKTEKQRLNETHQDSGIDRGEARQENEFQRVKISTKIVGESYLGNLRLSGNDDVRKGFGVFLSDTTGCRYVGEVFNDLRHGYGISSYEDEGKYCGQFRNNKKQGVGTITFPDSSFYHGDFNEGNMEGKGTLCFGGDNYYTGEWKAGVREGEGTEKIGHLVYNGQFQNGKRHGNGSLFNTKLNGATVYRGQWKDGEFCGRGVSVEHMDCKLEGLG